MDVESLQAKGMYSEKSKNELLELLDQHRMLTFESQLELNTAFEKRCIAVNKSGLEATIAQKLEEIKNLDYLTDFGFSAQFKEDGIVVTRTTKALLTDSISVIVGLLVFLTGIYGIASLVSMFMNGNEINVFSLAINVALASLVGTGFIFFNGLKRLFDYAGFSLSNRDGAITMKKRFDLRLEEIREDASQLFLETENGELIVRLRERRVFSSNAENLIQKMTMEQLLKTLGKNQE
ncbi:hypothetical protein [Maribacter sp. 2304DJ31-5]|uniref:hypothetical protein n=1 Tax=Maribacter sp. 2304DJ31-5 TaxID=3386273 RepID=UPI0039BD511D